MGNQQLTRTKSKPLDRPKTSVLPGPPKPKWEYQIFKLILVGEQPARFKIPPVAKKIYRMKYRGIKFEINFKDGTHNSITEDFLWGDSFIVVYSVESKSSFREAERLINLILKIRQKMVPILLIGARSGPEDDNNQVIPFEKGKELSDFFGIPFFEITKESVQLRNIDGFRFLLDDFLFMNRYLKIRPPNKLQYISTTFLRQEIPPLLREIATNRRFPVHFKDCFFLDEKLFIQTFEANESPKWELEACRGISKSGWKDFIAIFSTKETLRHLVVKDCGLDQDLMALFANSLSVNKDCEFLDLSMNTPQDQNIIIFADALKINSTLRYLYVPWADQFSPSLSIFENSIKGNYSLFGGSFPMNSPQTLEYIKRNNILSRLKIFTIGSEDPNCWLWRLIPRDVILYLFQSMYRLY